MYCYCYYCCCCCRWRYLLLVLLVLRPSISSLLQSAMVCYYKVRRLLQNATEHTVSLNGNPIVNNITKNLTVLNQNVKESKRERFAMFAISIVDNLCLPYCSSINGAKYDCCDFKIIDAPYDQISWQFLTLFGRCREVILAVWGCALVAVDVVERFKQEIMYGLSTRTERNGRCWRFDCIKWKIYPNLSCCWGLYLFLELGSS